MVLSTILLNFIALAVVGMLVQGPLHDPTTSAPQSATIAAQLRLPVLVAGSRLHLGVAAGAALVITEARESGRSGIARADGHMRGDVLGAVMASGHSIGEGEAAHQHEGEGKEKRMA